MYQGPKYWTNLLKEKLKELKGKINGKKLVIWILVAVLFITSISGLVYWSRHQGVVTPTEGKEEQVEQSGNEYAPNQEAIDAKAEHKKIDQELHDKFVAEEKAKIRRDEYTVYSGWGCVLDEDGELADKAEPLSHDDFQIDDKVNLIEQYTKDGRQGYDVCYPNAVENTEGNEYKEYVYTTDTEFETSRGIKLGAVSGDVAAAYGRYDQGKIEGSGLPLDDTRFSTDEQKAYWIGRYTYTENGNYYILTFVFTEHNELVGIAYWVG